MSALSESEAFRLLGSWPGLRPLQLEQMLSEQESARAVVQRLGGGQALPQPGHGLWLARNDAAYPSRLRHLAFPPSALYYKGDLKRWAEVPAAVAVVGTRRASSYALGMARELGRQLTERGVQVISGLARGIDAAVHLGCLEAARTTLPPLAVVGCGLDRCYPPEHVYLQQKVAERGAVISEYPPGTPPFPQNFPARNRIIAALAHTVVVVEAPQTSGTQSTVDEALALGRDVLALPGRIGHEECAGSNRLLQTGAGLVASLDDILATLRSPGWRPLDEVGLLPVDPRLAKMGDEPVLPEELCGRLKLSVFEAQAWLVRCELEGLVVGRPDGTYQRRLSVC
jgi:DNA processing protein